MSNVAVRVFGAIPGAAGWLPLFLGAAAVLAGLALPVQRAYAQTTGLPPAISGDCAISIAGAMTCVKTGGVNFAASATVDTTNAANLTTGNLAVARMASALASPVAIGFTAPNLARFAADTSGTPGFTQAFAVPSTPGAGTGTQPGTTGMAAGLTCQGIWIFSSGVSYRPVALCGDSNGNLYTYSANGATSFGAESWTKTMVVNGSGISVPQPVSANRFTASSGVGGFQGVLYTPASSSATCTAGTFWDDASYHYVCIAANTIRRVALTAF